MAMRFRWFGALALIIVAAHATAEDAQPLAIPGLEHPVNVYFDTYRIPHIYAETWTDAARVLGYIHATDRLWQMDLLRRYGSGTTAEVMGRQGLEADMLVRQLGIRRGCEEIWNSDAIPAEMRAELEAYTQGVNARIESLAEDELPEMFQALGYQPEPWVPVDCLVFAKFMAWDQSGTMDDLWFGAMVEKLGIEAVQELFPLDRPYEIPTVARHVERRELYQARLEPIPGAAGAYEAAYAQMTAAGWFSRGHSFGSNNWAVGGARTASGKPILCSDPHLGFSLPMIWYTAHMSVKGRNLVGVTFPGSPSVIIGHTDRHGWGITNMQADSVDYFVQTVDPDDPLKYLHRGEWKTMDRLAEHIPIKGEEPHEIHIDSTVHGPVIRREGRVVSMAWNGLGPTTEGIALWKMMRADSMEDFLDALTLLTSPPLNIVYADADGNIAINPTGHLPVRLPGQGRIPLDGASGDYDWREMIPATHMPLAVNPDSHFVASANGRPAGIDYPHYLGWMWDPSYRTRRIHDMLSAASELTLDSMKRIQLDVHDKAAEVFLPIMIRAVQAAGIDEPVANEVLDAVAKWDYVANTHAVGPVIWLRWFDIYRGMVWDDEWVARAIDQPGGSWGFTGNNRREPMLEVLEYMTREHPTSRWFNDQATDETETRDDIIVRAFHQAVDALTTSFGADIGQWTWDRFNVLKIDSLKPGGDRLGGPVPGTSFTVNPGGNIGPVGGGASFRMIVDFGDPAASVGVYPGGQSGDPASPHYDDQIPLWASGAYIPLHPVSDPALLPAAAQENVQRFVP
jgi:penicillin G amidase